MKTSLHRGPPELAASMLGETDGRAARHIPSPALRAGQKSNAVCALARNRVCFFEGLTH